MAPWSAPAPAASYAAIIRATYTPDELDHARRLEDAMLPRANHLHIRLDIRQTHPGAANGTLCHQCRRALRPCTRHHCPVREVGTVAATPIARPRPAPESR